MDANSKNSSFPKLSRDVEVCGYLKTPFLLLLEFQLFWRRSYYLFYIYIKFGTLFFLKKENREMRYTVTKATGSSSESSCVGLWPYFVFWLSCVSSLHKYWSPISDIQTVLWVLVPFQYTSHSINHVTHLTLLHSTSLFTFWYLLWFSQQSLWGRTTRYCVPFQFTFNVKSLASYN